MLAPIFVVDFDCLTQSPVRNLYDGTCVEWIAEFLRGQQFVVLGRSAMEARDATHRAREMLWQKVRLRPMDLCFLGRMEGHIKDWVGYGLSRLVHLRSGRSVIAIAGSDEAANAFSSHGIPCWLAVQPGNPNKGN